MLPVSSADSQTERRSPDELRQHYEIEKELANRLRTAPAAMRQHLYPQVYSELFRRVPKHPSITRVGDPGEVQRIVAEKMVLLSRFLNPETVFLEIGAGDCRLSLEVARHVKMVYAVDVSDQLGNNISRPTNFRLALSGGLTFQSQKGLPHWLTV